jgi:probable rRNA maturation factor
MSSLVIEVDNRSGRKVDVDEVRILARKVLEFRKVNEGDLGVAFVTADEIRRLKNEHLGIDEATDVLSFPIDAEDELPEGLPRQLGDVVICPQVVEDQWRRPLVHGLLHLLGFDHGASMSVLEDTFA